MKSKIVRQSAAILAAVQSDRGRQAFVWSVWLVMMAIALVNLVKYGRNIPLAEDWLFVAPLTGHESNLLHWLWSQNNEHRIPLFRLILLILLKLTHGDFRVGMFLSIISLGGLSLAMLQVAQSLRGGRTRFVDAFFPITLLHLGHWENLFWSWQFNFVLSVVLTGIVLLILVSQRLPMTPAAAIIAGVCLMLLPLCGATGLLFAPFLALWFGYCGLLHWNSNWRNWTAREPEGKTRWSGRFLIGSAVVALCLTGLYFVGYERPTWTPPNPGPGPSLWAALQFLALGWGPIARSSWLLSTIGIMGLLIPSAALAGFGLLRHRGPERHRALGIFVFFGTLIVFALGMGWGRAGTIAIQGNWPIRYVLLAVPTLWIAFFIWELYASPKVRLVAQGSLFLGVVLLLPFNTVHGLDWRDYYRHGMRRVEQDLRAGTPPSILAERHLKFLIHWWDAANLEAHMRMLYDAGSGPFARMRVAPASPKTLSPRVLSIPQAQPLVTQEIRYHMSEAGEVFFVWGLDGWQVAPEEIRPSGTEIKNLVMHTPMTPQGDTFVAEVQAPAGATIDYGFLITKTGQGAAVSVWEADGDQNYHTLLSQDGVIEVQTALTLAQDQVASSGLEVRLPWRKVIWFLIGIGIVAGGIALSYLPGLRSAVSLSSRSITPHIVAILVIAAILRLNHIRQPFVDAFSWREASTAMMADNFYHQNWNIFYPAVNWGGPGPGYQGREFQTISYLTAIFYAFLGQHDWIGRGVAVVFGLWGIFALYQLVRLVWDEKHALVSAAVMAVLPGSIFIERSLLPDPAMVALVVTSFWMLVAYLQTGSRRYLLLTVLIGMWGLLTKIPGLIIGLPMVYASLTILGAKRKLSPAKLITLGIVAILTLIPVLIYYFWARYLALSYPPYHFAGSGNWLWDAGLKGWWGQTYFFSDLSHLFKVWMWTTPVIALVAFGLLFRPRLEGHEQRVGPGQRSIDRSDKAPWLFHWWLLAGLIYYLIGAQELVTNPWNFHIINPAAAALAGHAILLIGSFAARIVRWPTTSFVTTGLFLLLIAIFGQNGLQWMYKPYGNESYKLGLALRQVTQPDDLVITMTNTLGDPVANYYSQRRGWVFPPAIYWGEQSPDNDEELIQMLEDLRAQGAGWLGIVERRKKDFWMNHPPVVAYLDRTCEFYSQTSEHVICRLLSPEMAAKPRPSPGQTSSSDPGMPVVTQKIHYHIPKAGEVFLVWGINGWNVAPEAERPTGTIIKDAVMHTLMTRETDTFVAQLQVPAGTTINYGFLVTKLNDSTDIEPVWERAKEDLVATADEVIDIETALKLGQDQDIVNIIDASLTTQEIRYHMPEADQVFLVWGINGWQLVPEDIRPPGTEIQEQAMHTPMDQEGDIFIAKVQAPVGATIDYGFLITDKRGIFDLVNPIWDGQQGQQIVVSEKGVAEIQTTLTLNSDLSKVLDIGPGLLAGGGLLLGVWFLIFSTLSHLDQWLQRVNGWLLTGKKSTTMG